MKPNSINMISILKGLLLTALAVFWIPFFLPTGIHSKANFEVVESAVVQDLDPAAYIKQDDQALRRYLDLDSSRFDGIAFYRIDDAMSAKELIVAATEDKEALQQLENAIDKRISSQTSVYEGYAPEQYALMKQALKDIQGNYALYYVGDNPQSVDETFLKALKGE